MFVLFSLLGSAVVTAHACRVCQARFTFLAPIEDIDQCNRSSVCIGGALPGKPFNSIGMVLSVAGFLGFANLEGSHGSEIGVLMLFEP